MIWAFVIILVLLIPLTAIVLDSQIGQALANRLSGGPPREGDGEALEGRIRELEAEVRYLASSVESLREETEFVRSLIEGPGKEPPPELPSGG